MTREARITIDGQEISEAESMTIRVALSSMAMDLQANGLGEDETGKAIAAGYLNAIGSILRRMVKP